MVERVLMTLRGHEKLLKEIQQLTEERSHIISSIKAARELGDLSENADYSAAKEAQALNASRLNFLETLCSSAHLIDSSKLSTDKVVFGVTARLRNLGTDEEVVYTIVSEYESSVEDGLLSIETPLAKALIGKRKGDIVEIRLPKVVREYLILEILVS